MEEYRLIDKLALRDRLQFDPAQGRVWLGESRMLLLHTRAMAKMRRELIQQMGTVRARSLMWNLGFQSGKQDAQQAASRLGDAEDYDVFRIGPALHALEGVTASDIVEADIDWEQGIFEGTVHWRNSWEVQAHADMGLPVDEDYPAACWSVSGYASGYVTEFFKRLVVFKETQCACTGHDHCVVVGRPAEMWDDQQFVGMLLSASDDPVMAEMEEELRRLRRVSGQHGANDDGARGSGPVPSLPRNIVGNSPAFLKSFSLLEKAAKGRISVMLLGETGVGKEVFARWLHENSNQADGPFIAVNCSAIPADLVEAELFGVRRGAYTGADETRPGRFERADKGTLFLDEVGDLPLAAQAKLLRVLQTGEVERLGDDKVTKVDVRLVSATNVDLAEAMQQGGFRSDLYYRLATYPIQIAPLRDRPGDVSLIAQAMLARFAPQYGKTIPRLTERALHALESYDWPGNVRELENYIERGVLLAEDGEPLGTEHLPPLLQELSGAQSAQNGATGGPGSGEQRMALARQLFDMGVDLEGQERMLVELAIRASRGNVADAARSLKLTRRQLAYRIEKFGLSDIADTPDHD